MGSGNIVGDSFKSLYLGEKKQGKNGIAFMIMKKLMNEIIVFRTVSGRMAYLRIYGKPLNMSPINIHIHNRRNR